MSMQAIKYLAEGIITSPSNPDYIENWFSASGFFGTKAWHGPYRNVYFITRDNFMGRTIYAARKITSTGIETLKDDGEGFCDSMKEAKARIREDAKS